MDGAEEIAQLLRSEKRDHVDGDTLGNSPTQAVAVTKVLDDDNLLREIIVRVGFPTTLVRAALVCRRWLGHASDPKLLSRFRKLHPPRLLGYYITEGLVLLGQLEAPRFFPTPPQPPEEAAIIRLESYNFGAHKIMDCRNGSIFTKCKEGTQLAHGVHRPLCAEEGMEVVPPLPPSQDCYQKISAIVSKEEGSGLSYFYVSVESTKEVGKSMARVYMLQDGVWRVHTSATCYGLRFGPKALLSDSNIYIPAASCDDIIVLDLTTSSFSTIQLPEGMKYYHYYRSMLAEADYPSSVHLIHVEEFQLCVWLHKEDNWLLVDTICLLEMLATLGMSEHTLQNEGIVTVQIIHVGDNGQFVFVKMGQFIFYLDIKCKTLRKVYEKTGIHRCCSYINPVMMMWPPTFPALKGDHARFSFDL